jgi:ribosomal protein L11 methyltransferase
MELWELRVEIAPASAGATDDALAETGCDGWTLVEDAIAKRAWILGIFPSDKEAHARWAELMPALPEPPAVEPEVRLLPDADWKNSYKAHFKAWAWGRLHWVPVWERDTFVLPEGHAVLWLDPGMAFGTGNHETTRLVIERMVAFEAALAAGSGSHRMIDAGCGSGILALSAVLLGFSDVFAFDNDPEAVRIGKENAVLNGLASEIQFVTGGIAESVRGRTAGFVAANIQSDVLVQNADDLLACVAPGGMLALSGILATERHRVREAFAARAPGWTVQSRVLGEWSDVCLTRPVR